MVDLGVVLAQLTVASILPTQGPISGVTTVTVASSVPLISSDNLMCKFGTNLSPARYISSSRAECVAPAVASPVSAALSISNNNQDYSASVGFTYQGLCARDCAKTL
jgi:hypothetical protein